MRRNMPEREGLLLRQNKKNCPRNMMQKKREDGVIVIETTISLVVFIFAIYTILSLVDIAYVQAKMSVALNTAAKEISEYSYLYYKLNLDELDKKIEEGTSDSKQTVENTIDGISTVMTSFQEVKSDLSNYDADSALNNLYTGADAAGTTIKNIADQIAEDPSGFILGMGKLAGSELSKEARAVLMQIMAKALMKRNLRSFSDQDPDTFLRRCHVVDGLDGLDFDYSSMMAGGSSDTIILVVTYEVKIIQLLNMDFTFTFRQCAKTKAWGNGVSSITW